MGSVLICRFEPWPGTLCCVLEHGTLLSQCLSPPWCINGYREIQCREITQQWISIPTSCSWQFQTGVKFQLNACCFQWNFFRQSFPVNLFFYFECFVCHFMVLFLNKRDVLNGKQESTVPVLVMFVCLYNFASEVNFCIGYFLWELYFAGVCTSWKKRHKNRDN